MPSPMKRKTYLGLPPNTPSSPFSSSAALAALGAAALAAAGAAASIPAADAKAPAFKKLRRDYFILFHAKVLSFHEPHGSFSLFRFTGNGLILPPQPPGPKPCGRKIGVKPRRRLWAVCKKEDFCCAKSAPPVKRRDAFCMLQVNYALNFSSFGRSSLLATQIMYCLRPALRLPAP